MFKMLGYLTLSCLLLSVTGARKTYLLKSPENLQAAPRVRDYDCTKCLYQDDNNKWCLDLQMNLRIGWEWFQEQTDNVSYRWRLDFYQKQDWSFHPEFDFTRLIYYELNWKTEEFK